jgi:hypothetical protein
MTREATTSAAMADEAHEAHEADDTADRQMAHEHGEPVVGAHDLVPPGPAGAPAPGGTGLGARATRALRLAGPPTAVFAVIIAVWYAITYGVLTEDRRFLLPPPHQVITDGFLAAEARGEILDALWVSTKVALIGLAIAFVLGSLLAIVMSQASWIERSLYPYAVFLQTVPILALVPVMGFWFGFGTTSRITVCDFGQPAPAAFRPRQPPLWRRRSSPSPGSSGSGRRCSPPAGSGRHGY